MNSEGSKSSPVFAIVVLGAVALIIGVAVWYFVIKPVTPAKQVKPAEILPPSISASYLPEARPVIGLQFVDQDNQPFTEQRFKGKWSFMFFGFLNCPDVCPATLLIMKSVWAKLPEKSKQAPEPQLIFVSVDPDRDKPEAMKSYIQYYNPEFIGIVGEHKFLDILTVQVNALYGYEDSDKESEYTVNHSAHIVLIDPQGKYRAVFTTPHEVDKIVNSFNAIREYYSK